MLDEEDTSSKSTSDDVLNKVERWLEAQGPRGLRAADCLRKFHRRLAGKHPVLWAVLLMIALPAAAGYALFGTAQGSDLLQVTRDFSSAVWLFTGISFVVSLNVFFAWRLLANAEADALEHAEHDQQRRRGADGVVGGGEPDQQRADAHPHQRIDRHVVATVPVGEVPEDVGSEDNEVVCVIDHMRLELAPTVATHRTNDTSAVSNRGSEKQDEKALFTLCAFVGLSNIGVAILAGCYTKSFPIGVAVYLLSLLITSFFMCLWHFRLRKVNRGHLAGFGVGISALILAISAICPGHVGYAIGSTFLLGLLLLAWSMLIVSIVALMIESNVKRLSLRDIVAFLVVLVGVRVAAEAVPAIFVRHAPLDFISRAADA
jgi:hypothetical protein